MIGMVLAAGAGRRLRPYTDTLPKALVPVATGPEGETTILDIALANMAEVELTDIVVVVGYRAEAVEDRKIALEKRYGVTLTLVAND
jgi:NDP-sugar pyrophosphorylase family protein